MTEPSAALPGHYDDLDATLVEAWAMLVRGAKDRRSPFHTPVLATLRADRRPAARTVVLRHADPDGRTLRFHTDRRSPKFAEIAADPRVSMHFYDPAAKVQLCIDGRATGHAEDEVAGIAWRKTRPMSRVCYRVEPGPGTGIETPHAVKRNSPGADGEAGREHFSAVTIAVDGIEWLYLAAQGHRRALFQWSEEGLSATWLVP